MRFRSTRQAETDGGVEGGVSFQRWGVLLLALVTPVVLRAQAVPAALSPAKEGGILFKQARNADARTRDGLAEGLLTAGRTEDSLAGRRIALSTDPWFAHACLGEGRCLERMGNPGKARDSCRRYLEIVPRGRTADSARERLKKRGVQRS